MAAFSSGTITGATALHHYAGLNSPRSGDEASNASSPYPVTSNSTAETAVHAAAVPSAWTLRLTVAATSSSAATATSSSGADWPPATTNSP